MPDTNADTSKDAHDSSNGYARSVELLRRCSTEHGFVASPTQKANYHRIWGRDGVILGLAALLTEDPELIGAFRRTLHTLAQYQGPHGEIPSNVAPSTGRISYGGTTGRVDADLWFVIGCGEYWKATGDDGFLAAMLPVLAKVRFLLGAWEFNNRGLLYVPQTGDWADEYVHSGYVLYDQLLYLQALRTFCEIHCSEHESPDHGLKARVDRLKHMIGTNYWLLGSENSPDDVYHEVLYQKGRDALRRRPCNYWMPFFSPQGYGYRFDAFANVLASLFSVANAEQRKHVDRFIHDELTDDGARLLPAFWPVIKPVDKDWEELQVNFSYVFKNRPHEYHNGGLWPMITGFYVADLAARGNKERAGAYLSGIHWANGLEMGGEPWSFPEFVHGRNHSPGGTRHQGWSAAAAVIGQRALEGKPVMRIRGG